MRRHTTTSTIHTFSPQRTYRYGYDSLSRLIRARYSDSEGGAGRYDTRYSYDLNGNLTSLVRRGALSLSSAGSPSAYGAIDSLTLEYAGNHLGNNRVDVAADGRVCQVTDYYPYGLPMASSRYTASQRWLFGGKELDRISGLDLYDFEARAYDPALARFSSPDPLTEDEPFINFYSYCLNNPIVNIDPTGEKTIFVNGYLGFGAPDNGLDYWGGKNSQFLEGAKRALNDKKQVIPTIHHHKYSHAIERETDGYKYAAAHYKEWIADMAKEEVFNLVSHSMGSAFAKGIERFLKEKGRVVRIIVMINTFQSNEIHNPKSNTIVYDCKNSDWLLEFVDGFFHHGGGRVENTIRINLSDGDSFLTDHRRPIYKGSELWNLIINDLKAHGWVK